jgi:hypothetical protein
LLLFRGAQFFGPFTWAGGGTKHQTERYGVSPVAARSELRLGALGAWYGGSRVRIPLGVRMFVLGLWFRPCGEQIIHPRSCTACRTLVGEAAYVGHGSHWPVEASDESVYNN